MRLLKQLVPALAVLAVAAIGSPMVSAVQGNALLCLILGLALAAVMVVVYTWTVRKVERRDPAELAREGAASGILRGVLIGVAMFGCVILNLALLGFYRVEGIGSVGNAIGMIGFMAVAIMWEELIFRGFLFRVLEQRAGTWIALVLSGLVFGLVHMGNANATLWGAIAIAIEAGGMLGAAYAATRKLWVPIGLHFGWNYATVGLFGAVTSGNEATEGLLSGVTSGPDLITGGAFGPEGSPYAVVFGLLLTLGFLWLARRRGNLVPMRRRGGQNDQIGQNGQSAENATLPR